MNIHLRRGSSPTTNTVGIGPLTLVFSYETCVAFAVSGEGWCVSQNVWSRTTGKHLNQETPLRKEDRTPHAEFERRLAAVLERIEVSA